MKVWCCLIMCFALSMMNSASAKTNSEGALLVSSNGIPKAMKTGRFPFFKAKETKNDWTVNKAVATPKSIRYEGNGLTTPKNNSANITGTGIHRKR